MEQSRVRPSKGFLLEISPYPTNCSWQSNFDNVVVQDGCVLYYDERCSKNTFVDIQTHRIFIYKGDKHLYQSFRSTPQTLATLPVESLTGTNIVFDRSNKQLTIKTDILGTEPIFYTQIGKSLWVTDRIDNFSRFFDCSSDILGIYSFIAIGAHLKDSTSLNNVFQTTELETITYNSQRGNLKAITSNHWRSDPDADVESIKQAVNERLIAVLNDAPSSTLMLSAGWDSRVLMSESSYIKHTYTHGDIASREVRLAKELGKTLATPMSFVPLKATHFGPELNDQMLCQIGQCLFPHWYQASKCVSSLTGLPMASGMFVEHYSGHYGINIVRGVGRKRRTLQSLLVPNRLDKIPDTEAIKQLAEFMLPGFKSLPWFIPNSVNFEELLMKFRAELRACFEEYTATGTSGIQELSERFKMLHVERQYMAKQTKTASAHSGYHHPFADAQFSQLVLQLKYRHRVGYKLSKSTLESYKPALLDYPLAATLVNAKSSIFTQELSRFVRRAGEQIYAKSTGKLPKGLGWNNFQFLNTTDVFHQCIDNLKNAFWDKVTMHQFVSEYRKANKDAYSLVVMLGRIATIDYQTSSHLYK
ncbi:hypothetical protein OPS25_01945 [Alteromonas ponticola]|uniref:Asparagine synthetase domain-containing protein n=1 Tax=Alteromonas aquimaris TaxID=2998417 RepID=A0ABT3P5A2_9ALTE|nr:hypothetical protein [Alteromonas aquimaris]MCW8107266.1 hypothetical protein [Alteromonas aquimaris]